MAEKQHIPLDATKNVRPQLSGLVSKASWCPEDGRKRQQEIAAARESAHQEYLAQEAKKDPTLRRIEALEAKVATLLKLLDGK